MGFINGVFRDVSNLKMPYMFVMIARLVNEGFRDERYSIAVTVLTSNTLRITAIRC